MLFLGGYQISENLMLNLKNIWISMLQHLNLDNLESDTLLIRVYSLFAIIMQILNW